MRPRAIVIPFGVPDHGRGLGFGVAAVVHGCVRAFGSEIALAQLHSKPSEGAEPSAVESFVPPSAWRDLTRASGESSEGLELVLTGAFEPPADGVGSLRLLAFDPRSGATRAMGEKAIDDHAAGRDLVRALEDVWSEIGADGARGALKDLEELDWSALESVLLAERCAVVDPIRGGPFDAPAALAHLERAVSEAPRTRWPAARLAALALELGSSGGVIGRASLRALERAALDVPDRAELLEAQAVLHLRLGEAGAAEARAHAALGVAPRAARLWVIVSEARRALGNMEGALEAVHAGLRVAPNDPVLETERGVILALRGDELGARHAWSDVLDRVGFLPAWMNLATVATKHDDHVLMQRLVDLALAWPGAHPDLLRRAAHLALVAEPEGVARATRVAKLARELLARNDEDAPARVVLARALSEVGEREAALGELAHVERTAPGTPAAAEAQRGRLVIRSPLAARRVDDLLARVERGEDLSAVARQARALSLEHESWVAAVVEGLAERRAGRLAAAREAFARALEWAPGAISARAEMAEVLLDLGEARAALEHGNALAAVVGDDRRALTILARAHHALGQHEEARARAERVLANAPEDPTCASIVASKRSWIDRLLGR